MSSVSKDQPTTDKAAGLTLEQMSAIVTGHERFVADDWPILHVDPAELAHGLGGKLVSASQIVCPGPGHSARDRSLSILIDPKAADGFLVHSFTGDDFGECRDMVNEAIRNLPKGERRTFADRPPQNPEDKATFIWARSIWKEAGPVEPAAPYFQARGLSVPPLARGEMRLHPRPGGYYQTIIANVVNVHGATIGFHFTYLRDDGLWKAPIKPDRRTFGTIRGGAIRLRHGYPIASLLVAEGIETALTAMQCDPQGRTAWAAINAGNLAILELPPEVRSVLIFPDGDRPTRAHPHGTSQENAEKAKARWQGEGREVRIWRPPVRDGAKGFDLNDILMADLGLRRPSPETNDGRTM